MCGIKIPLQDFTLKMQGGLMREGGAYLRDTTVLAGLALATFDKCQLPNSLTITN